MVTQVTRTPRERRLRRSARGKDDTWIWITIEATLAWAFPVAWILAATDWPMRTKALVVLLSFPLIVWAFHRVLGPRDHR